MTTVSARFTNENQTFGVFVRASGEETSGPLPPNAGDILSEYQAWIAEGNEPEPYVAPPVDLVAYAAQKRWEVEVSDIPWNEYFIAMDRETSQPKLLAEFVGIVAGVRADPSPWKFRDGFVTLTNAQMQQVCLVARTHVADAFAKEEAIVASIQSDPPTITTTAEIDAVFAA